MSPTCAESSTAPVSKISFVIAGTSPRRAGRPVMEAGGRPQTVTTIGKRPHPGTAPRTACEVEHDRSLQVEDVQDGAHIAPVWVPSGGPDQMGQERCPREISGSRRGEDVLRAGSEIAGSSSAQERPCAATRLPLTSQHRRKPGTGGFTSYQFEPHLAHLLVSSSVVRTFYCTRASAAVVNQDVRIVGNCASADALTPPSS